MDLETVRDWLVIYAGLIWIVLTLIVAVIFAGLWFGASWSLGKAHQAVTEKVRPALNTTRTQLAAIQDRSARLPGLPPPPEGAVVSAAARPRQKLRLPFRKKKRRIPFIR